MEIVIEPHTLVRAQQRGASETEIRDVLANGSVDDAKGGREARSKVFAFHAAWAGRTYPEKRVKVIYTVADGTCFTVTVYVYYGKWSDDVD